MGISRNRHSHDFAKQILLERSIVMATDFDVLIVVSLTTPAGKKDLSLTGSKIAKDVANSIAAGIDVDYEADIDTAFSLGPVNDAVTEITRVLGLGSGFDPVTEATSKFQGVPGLDSLTTAIASAELKILKLSINTSTGTFGFGFALDFTNNPLTLGSPTGTPPLSISLTGLGFTMSHTKK
jgi:hypothetical protein